jgi:transcriptional regulator with XRE-family HTH domain
VVDQCDTRQLGERLAGLRRRRGLTQEGLAERSTISVSVIRKLEQGERDSACLSTLRKLAGALRVTTMQLFAPSPSFAGPVDEDERNDLYQLRRVLQPPRGVDGAALLSLADEEVGPNSDDLSESLRIADRLFRDDDFAAVIAVLPILIIHARWALAESARDQRGLRSRRRTCSLPRCSPSFARMISLTTPLVSLWKLRSARETAA